MTGSPWSPVIAVVAVLAACSATAVSFVPGTWTGLALSAEGAVGCAGSGPVVEERFWTPVLLVDSPFGGAATATGVASRSVGGWAGGSFEITAQWGEAAALLSLDHWSLHRESTIHLGPGQNPMCQYAWTAVDQNRSNSTLTGDQLQTWYWLPAGTMSDAGEPEQRTIDSSLAAGPLPTVVIPVGFTGPTLGTTESCSAGAGALPYGLTSSQALRFTVPFEVGGHLVPVSTSVAASVSYTYTLAANATGILGIDDSAVSSGYGLAFDWHPCE